MKEITPSNYTMAEAAKLFGTSYHSFRNYVDQELFAKQPPMITVYHETKVIRYFPIKAFHEWLENLHLETRVERVDPRRVLSMASRR